MKYQLFDIVVLRPQFGSRIYGIAGVGPPGAEDAYLAIKLDKGPVRKCYHLDEDEILGKIGALDGEAVKRYLSQVDIPPPVDWEIGQEFARYMAKTAPDATDRRRWTVLAALRPGDPLNIRSQNRKGIVVERHLFHEVLPKGQKFHFAAVGANGTIYRCSLRSLELPPEENVSAAPNAIAALTEQKR